MEVSVSFGGSSEEVLERAGSVEIDRLQMRRSLDLPDVYDVSGSVSRISAELSRLSTGPSGRSMSDVRGRRSEERRRTGSSRHAKSPRAGTRRMRRFYNNLLLKSNADPEDLNDPVRLRKLFQVNRASMFRGLVEDARDRRKFEPFLACTEDQQEEHLRALTGMAKRAPKNSEHNVPSDQRYKKIDRKVRELFKMRTELVLDILESFEGDVRDNVDCGLVLEAEDGVGRMVLHGVAQYYGMSSRSEEHDGIRCTVLKPTKNTVKPTETLGSYIALRRRHPTGGRQDTVQYNTPSLPVVCG